MFRPLISLCLALLVSAPAIHGAAVARLADRAAQIAFPNA